jgi:hypothetical protein
MAQELMMGEPGEEIRNEALVRWQTAQDDADQAASPPFTETTEYLRELTKLPEEYPGHLKSLFWAYYTKDITLGNLTPQDRVSLKNRMALIVNIAFVTMPDYEYTIEKFLDFTNFKHLGANQAFRGGEGFERIMETQQTRLAITEAKGGGNLLTSPRRGIISRIFGGGR